MFVEQIFPDTIAEGARGGRGWSTDLVRNRGGFEKGNANWGTPLGRWEVGQVNRDFDETRRLQQFFHGVARGKLNSFRFHDRKDAKMNRVTALRLTSTTYQMRQNYLWSTGNNLILLVKKPFMNDNTLVVTLGGTEVTDYTVDTTTGILTFGSAIATTTTVRVTGGYHIPVRFDTDYFEPEQIDVGVWTWPSVPLVEVRI